MVGFKKGNLEDYDNEHYIEGCIYFLLDENGEGHIYLNGSEYTCSTVTSSKVQLNENQTLNDVLPTVYGDSSGAVVVEKYVTQAEYDMLDETDQLDDHTAYRIYSTLPPQ